MTVEMTSKITVTPIRHLAEDRFVAEAARVSTLAEVSAAAEREDHYQAGREKGHEEALTVLKRLYDEGDCPYRACLRIELEVLRVL